MAQTDSELIELSKAGNAVAFEQLIYRYDQEVLNIASRFTRSSDDAKDIYQETFIRVFKGLAKFQHKSEFSTWLFRITTNVCLTHTARVKKTADVMVDSDSEDESHIAVAQRIDEADTNTYGNEISHRIESALQKLSGQQKMVFTLRHYQDYKLKDIAVMMNCAEGTVKKYLFEATKKMKTHLHDLYE